MSPPGVIPKRHSNEWITIYHLFYSGSDSVNGHIPKKPYTTLCIQATATYYQSPVGRFMYSTNIYIVIIAIGSSLHVLWTVTISHNFLRTVLSFLHFIVERVHSSFCHHFWSSYQYNNSGSRYWIKTVHFVNFTWYWWVVRKLLIYHSFGHLCMIGVYYKVQC